MKKVISAVLTAAMVVGMGVSVLAATPSKTVADEVKAAVLLPSPVFWALSAM